MLLVTYWINQYYLTIIINSERLCLILIIVVRQVVLIVVQTNISPSKYCHKVVDLINNDGCEKGVKDMSDNGHYVKLKLIV